MNDFEQKLFEALFDRFAADGQSQKKKPSFDILPKQERFTLMLPRITDKALFDEWCRDFDDFVSNLEFENFVKMAWTVDRTETHEIFSWKPVAEYGKEYARVS